MYFWQSLGFLGFSDCFSYLFDPFWYQLPLLSAFDHFLFFSAVLWPLKFCKNNDYCHHRPSDSRCTFGLWVCDSKGIGIIDELKESLPQFSRGILLPAEILKPVSKTDVIGPTGTDTEILTELMQIRNFLLIPMQIS